MKVVDKAIGSLYVQYDKSTDIPFVVQYLIALLETMDTEILDKIIAFENIVKAAIGANISLKDFDAYNSVSDDAAISNAISYQKQQSHRSSS